VAELLSSLTEEYDPHVSLYEETLRTLDRLAEGRDARVAVLRFELVILREIGQLPQLDECSACGRSLKGQGEVAFWVSQGGLLCRNCQRDEYRQNRIQAGTAAVLRQLAGESDTALDRLGISQDQFGELRHFTTAAISHVLGRRPKTLRYLQF
jgi:DNA repair protein RecO (recombination protein O)